MDGTGRLDPESGGFTETYDPDLDVLVAEVPTASLEEAVDQFTIGFETTSGDTYMVFRWERTEVRVPLAGS